ncbi:MAG TPA: sigma 54-interacting transcriptional regulator [Terriglobia bacterium]|nr:sigma 54-interacting transcriptional regulator [Terriglobia bacterium]
MTQAASMASKSESDSELERHRALLDVSEAIIHHRDLRGLFRGLAELLRPLVAFDSLNLALYDPQRRLMRLHILETELDVADAEGLELPVDESPGGTAWKLQQPVILTGREMAHRFPAVRHLVEAHHIEHICILPLTSAQRRLGAMSFVSTTPRAYSEPELEFLQQVARQVAVAVENALNYELVQCFQKQLAQERDRLEVLLEVTSSVVANLELGGLLTAISASLRRVVQHDYASLALLDSGQQNLRLYALDFPSGKGILPEGMAGRAEGTPPGRAILTRKPCVIREGGADFDVPSELGRLHRAEGLRSAVFIPLISRDRVLGTLNVASRQVESFSAADIELLISAGSQIAIAVENALAFQKIAALKDQLAEEKLYLEDEIQTEHNFEEIIGESPSLMRALTQVETVAPTDSSVLILGETGTGKELIARAIHNLSSRRDRALVKLNCAAIPSGLLESELFGHERGAFTGAITSKAGRFELADRGTLFLDEVGDIPLELQPKLLRVLQEREFERLGNAQTLRVDVRLVAATNQDLGKLVEEKRFRSDLFYRLNVFPITVPALRERTEDIPTLVRYFTQKYSRRMNKQIETVPAEAIEALRQYHWPGNVRELENFVERAVILTKGFDLYLPLSELKSGVNEPSCVAATLEDAEREHIVRTLRNTNWLVGGPNGAATRLGMKRTTLQSKMRKLNIVRPSNLGARI